MVTMIILKDIKKYKDLFPYIFFGICTTAVNLLSYWFMAYLLQLGIMISTISAWTIAVLFAYVTNRKWVFHSKTVSIRSITKELVYFVMCRLITGFVDWGCMFAFVTILRMNDLIIKLMANILVIIINYIASKFIIFK